MNYLPSLPILAILQILYPYFLSVSMMRPPLSTRLFHGSGEWHALKCYRFTTQDGHGTEANRQWAVRYRVSPDQKLWEFQPKKIAMKFWKVLLLKL